MDINMDYPPTNLDYINHLPEVNRLELRDRFFTALDPGVVYEYMGNQVLCAVFSTNPTSPLHLSCDGFVGALTWETSPPVTVTEEAMMRWMFNPDSIVGFIRNQFRHVLCWGFVSTDMLSSGCILHGWESDYCPFSPWYLYLCCDPTLILSQENLHMCYPYRPLLALQYINCSGVTKVEVGQELADFDCTKVPPLPPLGEAASMSQRVKGVRSIATLEEALEELKFHPVACNLVYYDGMFTPNQVYTGPNRGNTAMLGIHAVIMVAVMFFNGKLVALCKMSNGVRVGFKGYVLVCLSTMYMYVGSAPDSRHKIPKAPRPARLLSDFVVLDMYDNEKDKDDKKPGHSNDEKDQDDFLSKVTLSIAGLDMAGSTSSSVSVESSSPEYVRGPIIITRYDNSGSFPTKIVSSYPMSVPPPVSNSSSVAGSSSSSVAGSSSSSVAGPGSSCLAGSSSSSVAGPGSSSVAGSVFSSLAGPGSSSLAGQKYIDFDVVGTDGSLKPLQEVLEGQTDQKGSKILPQKRRFDFSHGQPVDHGDVRMVGSTVNKQIKGELDVFPEEEVYCDPVRVKDECLLNAAASHEKEAEDASEREEKVDP